jgi:hypothetical protein
MRATLAACCGRAAAADSSHSAAQGSSEASRPSPRPHTMTTQRGYRQLPRRAILACTQPLPVDLPTANDLPRRRPSSTLRWPSTAFASFEGQAPTSGRRPTVVDIAGDHADPGHPSRAAAGLIATPRDLIPVGHSGHPERTDVGGRTLDTWTLRRPHRTPATWQAPVGHRTLAPDTGHRTPDAGHQRGHGDDSTAGIRTTLAARERPHAKTPNRVCALALPAGCSAARRPSGASAHCSPET